MGPEEDPLLSHSRGKQAAPPADTRSVAAVGSGDFVHWYNLDGRRTKKAVELELEVGGRIRPVITPDDADAVETIITEHVSA